MTVFILVPIIAPAMGQTILLVADLAGHLRGTAAPGADSHVLVCRAPAGDVAGQPASAFFASTNWSG